MIPRQAFRFSEIAAEEFKTLKNIILFGSFTRDKFDKRSDVDILLIFEDRNPEREYLSRAVKIGNRIIDGLSKSEETWDFQFVITNDIKKIDPSMRRSIVKEGIMLFGKPLELNFEKAVFYSYSLADKTRSEMVRFNRALKLANLIEKKNKNALILSESEGREIEKIFDGFGVRYNKKILFEML